MGRILITGGAGYVGSHIVRRLAGAGRAVVVIDDLSQGHRQALDGVPLVVGDFGDPKLLEPLLGAGDIDGVVHMAAFCEVGTSIREPAAYYRNNVGRSLVLLEQAYLAGVRNFVFSSTCSVYGEPDELPITEATPCHPVSPYGETKLAFERALRWYHAAYGTRSISLRYFNAAGAHPEGDLGEDHTPESHLIPRLLQAVGSDSEAVPIFGDDYPTPDGTCIRDYVHVVDLAEAHVLALDALLGDQFECEAFNLASGKGASVLEVIEQVTRVTGRRPRTIRSPRRPGDPANLAASAARIEAQMGWKPKLSGLEQIVSTAWAWHRRHPEGYRKKSHG